MSAVSLETSDVGEYLLGIEVDGDVESGIYYGDITLNADGNRR